MTAWADESPWRVAQPQTSKSPPVVAHYRAASEEEHTQPVQWIVPPETNREPLVKLGKPIPKLGRPVPLKTQAPKSLTMPESSIIEAAGWDAHKPLPRPTEDPPKEQKVPTEVPQETKKEPESSELLHMPKGAPPAHSPILSEVPPSGAFVYSHGGAFPQAEGYAPVLPEGTVFHPEGDPAFDDPFGMGIAHSPHGPPGRVRMNFEFLYWTIKGDVAPPLVTSSPQFAAGILGPDTTILYGNDLGFGGVPGGRVTLGYWFSPTEQFGMEGSFFMLRQRTKNFTAGSNGDPLYARPFINGLNYQEDSELVAALNPFTGTSGLSGSVHVQNVARLLGADLNFRGNLLSCITKRCNSWHLDGIAGFRFMRLDESLTVTEDLQVQDLPPELANRGVPPGTRIFLQDRFATVNNFYGGQIGLLTELRIRRWFVNMSAKIALGATQQRAELTGLTTFAIPGAGAQSYPSGLLVQNTNSGQYTRTVFSVIPQFGVNLGYQLTDHCRVYVGYDLMVWTNVARPGRQIDRVVNPSQLPTVNGPGQLVGAPRPAFSFQDSTFWAQGLVAGMEWRF